MYNSSLPAESTWNIHYDDRIWSQGLGLFPHRRITKFSQTRALYLAEIILENTLNLPVSSGCYTTDGATDRNLPNTRRGDLDSAIKFCSRGMP